MIVCIMAVSFIPYWKSAPFVRLLIHFIPGMILGFYIKIPATICCAIATLFLFSIIAWDRISLRRQFATRQFSGVLLQLLLFSLGIAMIRIRDPTSAVTFVDRQSKQQYPCLVKINEDPIEKKGSWKTEASIVQIGGNDQSRSHLKLLLYFRKNTISRLPQQGELVMIRPTMKRIEKSAFFNGFDFKSYCARQDIYFQAFLGSDSDFHFYGKNQISGLDQTLKNIRRWVTQVLQKYITRPREAGLAEALLIGYRNDLDKTLVNSYAATGVVHVIAISGLHLGFIYLLLKKCTAVLRNMMLGRWLQPMIVLSGLWGFSLLAGASPSILRSAVMFGFLLVGEFYRRRSVTLNALAASAFILLWYEPYWLWDPGFQLSYTALIGILLYSKSIHELIHPRSKVVDEIWKLNAVTLSAQLMTTPISIYYFKQLPLLFLLTNFVAIPLSTVALLGELILCALSPSPAIASFVGRWVEGLIFWMNEGIGFFAHIPHATITNLRISLSQTVIFYILIIISAAWLFNKDKRLLPPALISATCFFIAGW